MIRIPVQEMKIQIRTVQGIRVEKTVVREMKEKIRNRAREILAIRIQVLEMVTARIQVLEMVTARIQVLEMVTARIQVLEMVTVKPRMREKTRFLRGLGFCQEIVGGIDTVTIHIQEMVSAI